MENSILGTNIEVNIIYDSRRFEKYEPFVAELARQGIEKYEIWPCVLFPSVVDSIAESHKMIVADAKARHLPMTCIMEDDVMFPHERGFEYFLTCMPTVFDIYTAGNYATFEKRIRSGAVLVDTITGFHCYIVHSRYYDRFLATPQGKHIDTAQASNLMYTCYPMAALQRPGFSANNKGIVNYNKPNIGISQEHIYGKLVKE
jgi:hypothetical protein